MQIALAFVYGHNAPPSSQGTCYKEAPLVSRTRVRHQVLRDKEDWRMVVTRMSNPLPSHDPAQLDGPCLLLAGHLNYFKTGTDAAWKSRPAADNWNLSIYALLSLSHPVLLDISESESLYNLFMLAHHHAAALRLSKSFHPPFFPNLSISRAPKHPYSCPHSSNLTSNSFLI